MRFGFTYPVVPFNKSAAFMVALFFVRRPESTGSCLGNRYN